jgi:hypothetical protein
MGRIRRSLSDILLTTTRHPQGVCQNKDLHNHYLQFEVIMPARRACENIAQGNALGFMLTNNYRPEGARALIACAFAPSGRL